MQKTATTTPKEDGSTVLVEDSTEQQSSIELSLNAKGEAAWKVKVYDDNAETAQARLEKYITIAQKAIETAKGQKS